MALRIPALAKELRQAIAEHGLDEVAEVVFANASECFSLVVEERDDYRQIGNTRFGGDPDLPPSMQWPCNGDADDPETRFSNFIAQINFAELPLLPGGSPLPDSGILYLFIREMDCAAEPVLLDSFYFDGDVSSLRRTPVPDSERLADKWTAELKPVRVKGVPAISLANFRKQFREDIKRATGDMIGELGDQHLELTYSLERDGQIGQLLGFANAGDIRQNLYRQLVLARLGQRELMFDDHWDSIEEYESELQSHRERGEIQFVRITEESREGVTWLINNREMISNRVAEWRLLFRLDSNGDMDLNMMDADPLYVFIRNEDLAARNFSDLNGEVTQG